MRGLPALVVSLVPAVASAQTWQDATASCLGTTAQWTNKVEVADVDGDGKVDMLFANGGNYSSPGQPEPTRVFRNTWGGTTDCTEISAEAVLGFTGLSRTIKAADVDGDGDLDLLTGGAYQTQLRLFEREGTSWLDATAQLPQVPTSVGDAEFGDVDNDGDLDLVLADWGAGTPSTNAGGRTKLYLNTGGSFVDVTAQQMPAVLVKWSWDIELADVDNDWDLDVLVACKSCSFSLLFVNNGVGYFTEAANGTLPQFANNYDFEPMDIDNDGDLDLVSVNDGPNRTEHIFVNRGDGSFANETAGRLTGAANPAGADDNVAVWLDYDSDADPDLLIGSLGAERLLANDGTGRFTLVPGATPNDTDATLGLAVADFDGDGRLDLLQGQGEIQQSLADKVQLASMAVAVDDVPPVVSVSNLQAGYILLARVHDFIGPSRPHDFQNVVAIAGTTEVPMTWSGGMLWRAQIPADALTATDLYEVCATDRRGNKSCAMNVLPGSPDAGVGEDGGFSFTDEAERGCCDAGGDPRGGLVLALLITAAAGSRRRRARSR